LLKLLFIAPRFPYPPQKGDQLTIFRRLKVLADLHEITLLSFVEKQPSSEDMKYVSMLCRGGVFTVSFNRTSAILHLKVHVFRPYHYSPYSISQISFGLYWTIYCKKIHMM